MTSTAKATAATSLDLSAISDTEEIDASDVTTPLGQAESNIDEARETVSVSTNDTHVKTLDDALTAGSGITITETGDGGDESLTIAADGANIGSLDAGNVSAGVLAHERGGLEADVSAYSGLLKITGGATGQAVAETDYVTPSGAGTLANKTLTTPTIASMTNAQHDHEDAAGGGQLTEDAIDSGAATSGYVLTANGAGAASWAAVGGGGAAPIDITVTAGEALAERDVVYVSASGNAFRVDADFLWGGTTPRNSAIRGVVNESGGISSAATGSVRISGEVSGFTGLTAWGTVYAGTTAGGYTQTRPDPTDGGGQVAVVPMGYAVSTTAVMVQPGRVTYLKRETLANGGTTTITHHDDPQGRTRGVSAHVATTGSEVTTSYASGNQDSDVALRSNDIRASMEAWWSLDETSGSRADSHGANTLTDNNTVGSAAGKQGNGADFEQANSESLSAASNSSLQTGDIDFTFALWAKFETSTSYQQALLSKWDTGALEYMIDAFSNKVRFVVNGKVAVTSTVTLSVGTWYHVVAYHDAANNIAGVEVNGTTTTAAIGTGGSSSTAPFVLGNKSDVDVFFDGVLDEVGYWKRLLTSAEKTFLYNSGAGRSYTETSAIKNKLAQSFQLGAGETVDKVRLWLKKTGSPTGTMTLRIETDSAGDPSGTLADANATVTLAESGLGTSYGWAEFDFGTNFALSGSTTYWLVLSTDRSASVSNYVEWGADGSAPSYADGEMKSEAAAAWSAESKDAVFEVYAESTVYDEPCVVGRSSGGTRDVGVRYDDGAGANGDTQTTFRNHMGASADVTCAVELE